MLSQIKNLVSKPDLNIGDVWYYEPEPNNPFRKNLNYARIKEIKDGWVNYSIGLEGGGAFQDEVMKERVFRQIYINKLENKI